MPFDVQSTGTPVGTNLAIFRRYRRECCTGTQCTRKLASRKASFSSVVAHVGTGTSMSLRYLGCRRLMFIVSASNLFRISSVTATPLRPSTCAIAKPNDPPPRITPLSIGPPPESTGPSCVGYSGGIPLPSKTTRPLLRFRHFRCDTRPTSFDLCDTYGGTRHSVPPSNRKYLNI